MKHLSIDVYKQQILNDFNHRKNYDNAFHRRAATQLVDLATLQPGQCVLDIATGTGLAAIAAAQIVGPTGSVTGTDFAVEMLKQAQQKANVLRLTNIEFEEVDADKQPLQKNQFDVILCSSAIMYLTDIPSSLSQWHNALKPGGTVAFSCVSETSPSASVVFRTVVQKYGVTIPNPNELLGTPERCCQLLEKIGFRKVAIATESLGFYSQNAEALWIGNANSAFGLQDVNWPEKKLERCQQEYLEEMNKYASTEGYHNEITMFFVTAQKVDN